MPKVAQTKNERTRRILETLEAIINDNRSDPLEVKVAKRRLKVLQGRNTESDEDTNEPEQPQVHFRWDSAGKKKSKFTVDFTATKEPICTEKMWRFMVQICYYFDMPVPPREVPYTYAYDFLQRWADIFRKEVERDSKRYYSSDDIFVIVARNRRR